MDVAAAQPNGRTVVLLHGRNFPSSYWAPVIKTLNDAGYRVVVPDQIGFGKSSKPQADLHFDTLARNTIALLDHLQIAKADIVAHSLGGMLGVRIARAFPDRVDHLVLTAPIGPGGLPALCAAHADRKNPGERGQAHGRRLPQAAGDQLFPETAAGPGDAVHRRAFNIKGSAEYPRWLRAFVNSAQLIYREPVVHEIPLITQPTLFIMAPTITTRRDAPTRRKRCAQRWARTPNWPRHLRPKWRMAAPR